MAEPVGVKEEVLLDEKWSGADEEKCDQQAERRRGDRSLHYQAVGVERGNKGDRSEERQDKGEESSDPFLAIIFPFLQDLRQSQAETSQSDDGEDDDAVVAEEGEDKGEREQTEEDVGQEVEGGLQPLEQGRLPITFLWACSDPALTAALISRHNSPMDIFAIASFL